MNTLSYTMIKYSNICLLCEKIIGQFCIEIEVTKTSLNLGRNRYTINSKNKMFHKSIYLKIID